MSEPVPPARMRASHADRERVVATLREAAVDGRLEMSEFVERCERVYEARTLGELPEFTRDLVEEDAQPVQVREAPVAALGTTVTRSGRWVVRPEEYVLALFGTAELDLRDALLAREHVRMTATSVFGRIRVHVPEGVEVRVRGWSFLGQRGVSGRRGRPRDGPVLELRGFCVLGSLLVRTPKRRWWLPWRGRRALE
ncbi:DUF1707 SHOCT-like domain-containing protein [Haloactinospora alba]|uniref:DUF1707 SHOCT-like domain-containing protein n=1 Tax=Haloactinospora alba TaxID=405555 RepID=UPI001FE52413|nr:DUF1707 domain-containing protein [Haloactinospora alba]